MILHVSCCTFVGKVTKVKRRESQAQWLKMPRAWCIQDPSGLGHAIPILDSWLWSFGGCQKGGFSKRWFWRMFPRNENRNEGTFRYRPKGVFGKGVGNSKNASEMRQKCVKHGSCFMWKEEHSKMRQKCVKIASKIRQNARNTFGGEHLLDDAERSDVPPERRHLRMFPRKENRNEGTFAKTTLLRNRPFVSQWKFLWLDGDRSRLCFCDLSQGKTKWQQLKGKIVS